jgi:hypothetical protein
VFCTPAPPTQRFTDNAYQIVPTEKQKAFLQRIICAEECFHFSEVGSGKTKVILPLLCQTFLSNNAAAHAHLARGGKLKHVLVVLVPEHLVPDARTQVFRYCLNLNFREEYAVYDDIFALLHEDVQLGPATPKRSYYGSAPSPPRPQKKQIFITSFNSFKKALTYDAIVAKVWAHREKILVVADEVDDFLDRDKLVFNICSNKNNAFDRPCLERYFEVSRAAYAQAAALPAGAESALASSANPAYWQQLFEKFRAIHTEVQDASRSINKSFGIFNEQALRHCSSNIAHDVEGYKSLIARPYESVNRAMPGSYYSDVERTIFLTYCILMEDIEKYDELFQQERKFISFEYWSAHVRSLDYDDLVYGHDLLSQLVAKHPETKPGLTRFLYEIILRRMEIRDKSRSVNSIDVVFNFDAIGFTGTPFIDNYPTFAYIRGGRQDEIPDMIDRAFYAYESDGLSAEEFEARFARFQGQNSHVMVEYVPSDFIAGGMVGADGSTDELAILRRIVEREGGDPGAGAFSLGARAVPARGEGGEGSEGGGGGRGPRAGGAAFYSKAASDADDGDDDDDDCMGVSAAVMGEGAAEGGATGDLMKKRILAAARKGERVKGGGAHDCHADADAAMPQARLLLHADCADAAQVALCSPKAAQEIDDIFAAADQHKADPPLAPPTPIKTVPCTSPMSPPGKEPSSSPRSSDKTPWSPARSPSRRAQSFDDPEAHDGLPPAPRAGELPDGFNVLVDLCGIFKRSSIHQVRDLVLQHFGPDRFHYIYHIDQADSSDRVLCLGSDNDVQFDEEFYKHLCNRYGARLRERVFFFVDNRNVIGKDIPFQVLSLTCVRDGCHMRHPPPAARRPPPPAAARRRPPPSNEPPSLESPSLSPRRCVAAGCLFGPCSCRPSSSCRLGFAASQLIFQKRFGCPMFTKSVVLAHDVDDFSKIWQAMGRSRTMNATTFTIYKSGVAHLLESGGGGGGGGGEGAGGGGGGARDIKSQALTRQLYVRNCDCKMAGNLSSIYQTLISLHNLSNQSFYYTDAIVNTFLEKMEMTIAGKVKKHEQDLARSVLGAPMPARILAHILGDKFGRSAVDAVRSAELTAEVAQQLMQSIVAQKFEQRAASGDVFDDFILFLSGEQQSLMEISYTKQQQKQKQKQQNKNQDSDTMDVFDKKNQLSLHATTENYFQYTLDAGRDMAKVALNVPLSVPIFTLEYTSPGGERRVINVYPTLQFLYSHHIQPSYITEEVKALLESDYMASGTFCARFMAAAELRNDRANEAAAAAEGPAASGGGGGGGGGGGMEGLAIGKRVIVRGLNSKPQFNGQRGEIVQEGEEGRWGVRLDGSDAAKKPYSLKRSNIELDEGGSGEGSGGGAPDELGIRVVTNHIRQNPQYSMAALQQGVYVVGMKDQFNIHDMAGHPLRDEVEYIADEMGFVLFDRSDGAGAGGAGGAGTGAGAGAKPSGGGGIDIDTFGPYYIEQYLLMESLSKQEVAQNVLDYWVHRKEKLQQGLANYGGAQGKGFICWRFVINERPGGGGSAGGAGGGEVDPGEID